MLKRMRVSKSRRELIYFKNMCMPISEFKEGLKQIREYNKETRTPPYSLH